MVPDPQVQPIFKLHAAKGAPLLFTWNGSRRGPRLLSRRAALSCQSDSRGAPRCSKPMGSVSRRKSPKTPIVDAIQSGLRATRRIERSSTRLGQEPYSLHPMMSWLAQYTAYRVNLLEVIK